MVDVRPDVARSNKEKHGRTRKDKEDKEGQGRARKDKEGQGRTRKNNEDCPSFASFGSLPEASIPLVS